MLERSNRRPRIFIVAAEKSGDELGAKLARDLRRQSDHKVRLSGIGGSAMAGVGLNSPIDISPLSILGFVEGLKAYPRVLQLVKRSANEIIESGADAAILIDSWGFMMRLAKELRKRRFHGKLIKYVAPQVWAMREGRSKILARGFDHLLSIHSFDAPYFTRHGLPTTYVGNPVFDETYRNGDGVGLRDELNIGDNPVAGILFGSRLSEIQRLAEPFARAVSILHDKNPDLRFISPVSDTIAEDVLAAGFTHKALQNVIFLPENRKLDCFAAMDMAIACSGTVTSQLASAGVPSVVGYRLNGLTYFIAKRLFKPNYISIVNIAANAPLMPEFVQSECNGENLAKGLQSYLDDPDAREAARLALIAQTDTMRGALAVDDGDMEEFKTSSARAASAVLSLLT